MPGGTHKKLAPPRFKKDVQRIEVVCSARWHLKNCGKQQEQEFSDLNFELICLSRYRSQQSLRSHKNKNSKEEVLSSLSDVLDKEEE